MVKAFVVDKDGKEIIVAKSDETISIEGNYYFPEKDVDKSHFVDSDTHTVCPWKGTASYKTIKVNGKEYEDGAWYYPEPKEKAKIKVGKDFSNYYAFWRGVEVSES